MGTTLSSIHILSSTVIEIEKFRFASFSDGWQTCIYGFSAEDFKTSFGSARLISKSTPDPVLHFFICDSESYQEKIERVFGIDFQGGVAKTQSPYLRKQILKRTLD